MNQNRQAYWHGQTLILHVYVQPRASRNAIQGWHQHGLKVSIKAAPVDGEANKQLIKFLAKQFKVGSTSINLVKGEGSRHKVLQIENPKVLPEPLTSLRP
jgi:uncharacterized protein (TIGR00251 family)